MSRKRWIGGVVAVVSVLGLAGCSPAVVQADYPYYGTVAELANASTAVVAVTIGESHQDVLYPFRETSDDEQQNPYAGVPEDQRVSGENGIEVTVYETVVDEVFLGELQAGQQLSVHQLGGDHTIEEGGVPLVEGTKYVLFLETYPGGVPAAIVGGSQGQFVMTADGSLSPALRESTLSLTREELIGLSD